ncbi:MAG: ATP synthase F0 subunit B [Chloroflexi bacterium]|nr:ATP synthase F0 subunit B [Chloroflexota bacterium]
MDILQLVDRLEELFNNSKPIPLTHSVVVDENAFMDIIDQMRISIPDDIKKSQQVLAQKDRILAQAQEEANRTVAMAREKSEKMVEKSDIYQSAQAKVDQIADQAQKEAAQTKLDADRYVMETLTKLESELNRILSQVQNGIRTLEAEERSTANRFQ